MKTPGFMMKKPFTIALLVVFVVLGLLFVRGRAAAPLYIAVVGTTNAANELVRIYLALSNRTDRPCDYMASVEILSGETWKNFHGGTNHYGVAGRIFAHSNDTFMLVEPRRTGKARIRVCVTKPKTAQQRLIDDLLGKVGLRPIYHNETETEFTTPPFDVSTR